MERGTGKAWWVEQCVNHSPGSGTANPSTIPMRGPAPRGGMGASGPMGKGKLLGPWQLIHDRGAGQGLGRSGVVLAAPLVGTAVLLAVGRSGWHQAWQGTARFWKAAAHHGSPRKTLLVPVPLPSTCPPSIR